MDTFITESTQLTECHNHTVTEYIEQNQTHWQIIAIIFGLMNGLLVIVVAGEIFSAIYKIFIFYDFLHSQLKLIKYVNILNLGF